MEDAFLLIEDLAASNNCSDYESSMKDATSEKFPKLWAENNGYLASEESTRAAKKCQLMWRLYSIMPQYLFEKIKLSEQ